MRASSLLTLGLMAVASSADYTGDLRPQVHFSPQTNFMNDPNGLFFDRKREVYHLYYQYNPYEPVAGNQHWGHATSRDLYHWDNHPIAISPDGPNDYIFSGSAVIDSENTSGFFPDQDDGVVAIYTVDSPDAEMQHIAYSNDGGYTFTKYKDNPVIGSTSKDVRDPHVTWHAKTKRWVLVVAYAADRVIGFYTSPNLRDWIHASNFTQEGLPGTEFECPNLVRFSVEEGSGETEKYGLFISVNPGAPLGGSGTFYLVGDFDGTHFHSDTVQETLYDFAKDNYASQWYSGLPSDDAPISIGWASNWGYTEEVPTGPREGWRGSTALPRAHTLAKVNGTWVITQSPVKGLAPVLGEHLTSQRVQSSEVSTNFAAVASNAVYFDVNISGIPPDASGRVHFNFTSSASSEYVDGGVVLDKSRFWINRAGTHLFTAEDNADYTAYFNTTVSPSGHGVIQFSGVFDRTVLEVFLSHGIQSGTMVFYPTTPLDTLTVSVEGVSVGTVVEVDVWGLKSGWQ